MCTVMRTRCGPYFCRASVIKYLLFLSVLAVVGNIYYVFSRDSSSDVQVCDCGERNVKEVMPAEKVKPAFDEEVKPAVKEEVKPAVKEEVKPAEVKPAFNEKVKPAFNDKVKPAFNEKVKPAFNDKVKPENPADSMPEAYDPLYSTKGHKLAVLVPFRNRFEEMMDFVPHIHKFLKRQNSSHHIWVVKQVDAHRYVGNDCPPPSRYGIHSSWNMERHVEIYTYLTIIIPL